MQTKIDWSTGGISFYDVDPPKKESKSEFKGDKRIN